MNVSERDVGYRRPCSVEGCERPVGPKSARGWCPRHYGRWLKTGSPTGSRRPSAEIRFFAKVRLAGDCWEWTASLDQSGYGLFQGGGQRMIRSHIWSYNFFVGRVPTGLQLDHLCRNRACCNPWHLDPVTPLVNTRRGHGTGRRTHCPQGHPYDEANTYRHPSGRRVCRICKRASQARYDAKRRSAA